MAKLKVDELTGEILPNEVMVITDKAPSVVIDIDDVIKYHQEPKVLVQKIADQAVFAVFDVNTESGRKAINSHSAQIIRCITPACNKSKQMAEDAQKVVKQSLTFRRVFEDGIREVAAKVRNPLTEWEAEQERIRLEAEEAEAKRQTEIKYLQDWDDAMAFNELFDLRREKEAMEIAKKRAEVERDILAKRDWARQNADGYQFLFSDMAQLVQFDMEAFKLKVTDRVTKHKAEESAKLEAERVKIQQEEERKALALVEQERAKMKVEEAQKAIAAAKAEIAKTPIQEQEDAKNHLIMARISREAKGIEPFEIDEQMPTVQEMIDLLSHHYGFESHAIREALRKEFNQAKAA